MYEGLKLLQVDVAEASQPFFHYSTPRYTTFQFKRLTNEISFAKDDEYWEGPVNNGLFHGFFLAFSAVAMYLLGISGQIFCPPRKRVACLLKGLILFIGVLCFAISFFEFYSHIGIFHIWGVIKIDKYIESLREAVCRFSKMMSPELAGKLNGLIATAEPTLAAASVAVHADPELGNYSEGWELYEKFVTRVSKINIDENEAAYTDLLEFMEPLCISNLSLYIGEWDAFELMWKVAQNYVLVGVLFSIWTAILSFQIMRVFFTRSKFKITIISILGALTSLCWWIIAGFLVIWLIGLSDLKMGYIKAIHSILEPINENITYEIVDFLLNCTKREVDWPVLNNFQPISTGIVELINNASLAINLGYDFLPPNTKTPAYRDFLSQMLDLTNGMLLPNQYFRKLGENDCKYYVGVYEDGIGIPLTIHLYWAFFVSYVFAIALAILLTLFVILALRVRMSMRLACRKERVEDLPDHYKCLPECPRTIEEGPDPPPPIRRRCPSPCKGTPGSKIPQELIRRVMGLSPKKPPVCFNPLQEEKVEQEEVCVLPEDQNFHDAKMPKASKSGWKKQEIVENRRLKTVTPGPLVYTNQPNESKASKLGARGWGSSFRHVKGPDPSPPISQQCPPSCKGGASKVTPQIKTKYQESNKPQEITSTSQEGPLKKERRESKIYKPFGQKMLAKYKVSRTNKLAVKKAAKEQSEEGK